MAVVLKTSLWAGNARLQKAANNNPAMRQGDSNKAAVTLLQTALTTAGFPMEKGVDGLFGSQTAGAVVRVVGLRPAVSRDFRAGGQGLLQD